MKKLFKALTALAIGAGLVGASLIAAAPASAAPPAKPVCYSYTWNVETKTRVPGDFKPAFSYTTEGSGKVEVFDGTGAYVSGQGDATVNGRIASDFAFADATAGAFLTFIGDNPDVDNPTPPVGVIEVDLDANGTADTTLSFESAGTWADLSAANPAARVKAVGFDFGPNGRGYYYLVGATVGDVFSENFYYAEDSTYKWVVTGTGSGKVVPTNTATTRYVVTSQTVVKCTGK